ncbi:DUF305 domain-containing protein [Nonomuraea sp. K274]|uniref:DUF305 domain-containing protein n=1 Tax=Nonomuraea cypriaca TaxID=1187855 RepID=A0A931ACK4_9ACTN|nr:DUF305 domain-containing protein [Nonomuraea cypriaca]MBF8189090.1 DUF305 domain-containing protein [Nonomuraea cypriaca]
MRINRKMSVAVAAGALALVTACGGNSDSMAGREGMGSSSAPAATTAGAQPAGTFNDADVMFAQMMIPHHEQAVEMADLAPARAADPEIKELAAKIKAAQDPEIQTMKGWLTEWGKPSPEGGMGHEMPGVMSEEDMTKLKAAKGTEFDKLFAQQMIAHHNGAIEMARTEQANGSNPQAKELATTIETTQQVEVEQLQKILDRL